MRCQNQDSLACLEGFVTHDDVDDDDDDGVMVYCATPVNRATCGTCDAEQRRTKKR